MLAAGPGTYKIIAKFDGSESYWSSISESGVTVLEQPQAAPTPTPAPPGMTDTYVIGFGTALIIVVVVGFAILILRKR